MKRAALLALAVASFACSTTTTPPAAPAQTQAPSPSQQTQPAAVDPAILGAIQQLEQGVAQDPGNKPWIYILATYYDRASDAANVAKWLMRLDELAWDQGAAPHDFRNTSASAAVRDAIAALDLRVPRNNRAQPAFTLTNQRDLIPEGITYDPVDDVFYISSIYRRKIIRVDRNGRATDFTTEAQDGMLAGLGIHIDPERRLLWIATSTAPEMRAATAEHEGRSVLLAYDLRDRRLVRRIEHGSKDAPAFLNDFVILPDGSLLLTDTTRHHVARLAPGSNTVEEWLGDFRFPNGIALAGEHLYVADFRGINRVNLADKSRQRTESQTLLNGIDGLAVHRGNLVGIQNVIGKARVVRIGTDSGRVEILESQNPRFELPTTLVVVNDEAWFIANPGLRAFDKGVLWPHERLSDPVMLRLPL